MTREEYIYYAECRQASFTFKKLKRFREWCDMQRYARDLDSLRRFYENKANSDVVDILGFFAFEIIRSLTDKALEVKEEWDKAGVLQTDQEQAKPTLFARLHVDQNPLLPVHIHEANRRLQRNNQNPFQSFRSVKQPLVLI